MYVVFFFNDTATTEIYTLSLHDALPIYLAAGAAPAQALGAVPRLRHDHAGAEPDPHAGGPPRADDAGGLRLQVRLRPRRPRSEEHTSELQSRQYLVCRLLLEKKTKLRQW